MCTFITIIHFQMRTQSQAEISIMCSIHNSSLPHFALDLVIFGDTHGKGQGRDLEMSSVLDSDDTGTLYTIYYIGRYSFRYGLIQV